MSDKLDFIEFLRRERDAALVEVAKWRSQALAWKHSAKHWLDWSRCTEGVRDGHFEELEETQSALSEALAALRDLRKYARHGNAGAPCSGPCAEWQTGERTCTCGLSDVLSRADTALRKGEGRDG